MPFVVDSRVSRSTTTCRALQLRDLGAEVPDRSATLVGYCERERGRLHLRAVLRGRTEGVCDAIAEEDQK